MVLCLGEPLGGFCDVSCHFIFVSSFCCCSSFVNVLNSHFLFDIIPHPSVDYRRVFTPILNFLPSPSQSDSEHFLFQPFRYLLTASATVLSGHFLPQASFTLCSFLKFLAQTAFIKASLGAGSYSLKFAGLHNSKYFFILLQN